MQIQEPSHQLRQWLQGPFRVAAILFAITSLSYAQTTVGQILGVITDSSSAAVAGAAVTVTNEQTNDSRKTVSDQSGNYIFPQLPVGRYQLTAEAPGFQRYVATGIDLKVDDRRHEDVALKV